MEMQDSKKLADKLFPEQKSDLEYDILEIPPEKRRLHIETFDFSVSTICEYLDNGHIYIPEYQRGYVWNRSQASRLIESLIIQCPIPIIYLNQEQDEKLSVIDGNQRLNSIHLFLQDGFSLQGLTAYPELEGYNFSSLDPRIKRHILNRTLRCITILKETHPQIKFDVFERLNTGAVQLNAQEIRHGTYFGKFLSLIDDLVDEKIWKKIIGIRNDKRMKSEELVLRFFALTMELDKYQKPLNLFLNNYCEKNRNLSDQRILELKALFLNTINAVNYLFDDTAFKVTDENQKPLVGNINAALFDAQMVGVAKIISEGLSIKIKNKKLFNNNYYELLQNPDFKESITSGTSATTSVKTRIDLFYSFLKKSI